MRVRIDMDQVTRWWPVLERDMIAGEELEARISELRPHDVQDWMRNKNTPVFDLPDAFISRYERLQREMVEMQEVFEQLYRHQEGMKMYPTPKIDIDQYKIKD